MTFNVVCCSAVYNAGLKVTVFMYIYNLARSVQTQDTIKVVRYKSAVEPQGGKNWVRVCGLLPKTLMVFMMKICDFSTIFITRPKIWLSVYNLTLKSIPCCSPAS